MALRSGASASIVPAWWRPRRNVSQADTPPNVAAARARLRWHHDRRSTPIAPPRTRGFVQPGFKDVPRCPLGTSPIRQARDPLEPSFIPM
jgi:hypothetical protein